MGSAAAALLFRCGFPGVVLERDQPLAVRRKVAFAEAVISGRAQVDGVAGFRAAQAAPGSLWQQAEGIPVVIDGEGATLASLAPEVLVDARMAKRNLGTGRDDAPLVIGLGPGFVAAVDVT